MRIAHVKSQLIEADSKGVDISPHKETPHSPPKEVRRRRRTLEDQLRTKERWRNRKGSKAWDYRKFGGGLAPLVRFQFVMSGRPTTRHFEPVGSQLALVKIFAQNINPEETPPARSAARLHRVISDLIPEPLTPFGDAYELLLVADVNDENTSNPLWAWFALAICTQAGVAPPQWVWVRLLSVANAIVSEGLKLRQPREANKLATSAIAKATITKKHLREFRQNLTDLRIALQVHSLLQDCADDHDNDGGSDRRVKEAAEEVVKDLRVRRSAGPSVNLKYVYSAYHRWFYQGDLLLTPFPRNPARDL